MPSALLLLLQINLQPPGVVVPPPKFNREVWIVYGDSKSCEACYQVELGVLMAANPALHGIVLHNISRNGGRIYGEPSGMRNAMNSDIAAAAGLNVTRVLFNFGANDAGNQTSEQWETACAEVLDAFRVQFPTVEFYMMRAWRRGAAYEAGLNSIRASIDVMVASRPTWVHLGPDEAVFLENGDDGATYTDDGVHPNAAGKQLTAEQWLSVLGY